MVNQVNRDASGADDSTEILLGATYGVTPHFNLFAEATFRDRDEDLGDQALVGATVGF